MAKFRIRVGGKDSINNGVSEAPYQAMGLPQDFDPEADDDSRRRYELARNKLSIFVEKFCENGDGATDHVTLEFDTDSRSCSVVPIKGLKKGVTPAI